MLNDNIAKRLPPVWEETLARSLTSQAQNAHKIFANNAHKNQNDFWLGALGALGAGMTGGGQYHCGGGPSLFTADGQGYSHL
jgi:hypothetical protein